MKTDSLFAKYVKNTIQWSIEISGVTYLNVKTPHV